MPVRPSLVYSWSRDGLLDAIRTGRRTSRSVLEECLERIDEREPAVQAWVIVDRDGARAQADQRDAERASGMIRGPLHGVPIGVKDIIDVAGLPTSAGASRWGDAAAVRDADVVAALRTAGAVILGKTVTTAYAWLDPPLTTNPWDEARTPGGSSSGSAAALACGMCLGALGSQTGGSLIRPASYCGIAAMKPGFGRLSSRGIVPLAHSLDHPGILGPTASDLAVLWQALTGSLEPMAPALRPPRLGLIGEFFTDRAAPVALELLDRFIDAMRAAAAEVFPVSLPDTFVSITTQHRVMLAAEAAAVHASRYHDQPDDYPPLISRLIEEGATIPATAYIFAREHQERWKRLILGSFAGLDALVMPATPDVATDRSTTGDPSFNSPWSYLGLPALAIPAAVDEAGLPLGVQLVAAPYAEPALLSAALWCERQLASTISQRT